MLVVVTGASQGIGAAIARAFAAEPDTRLALVARDAARLQEVAAECETLGARAEPHPCDVTDDDRVHAVAREILERGGAPRVLVNNAGRYRPGTLVDTTADEFRGQVEVNLTSGFLVTRAFLPAMIEAGAGHVFFTASVASLAAYPASVAYCAAKHGLLGLARALREEVKGRGIRVTTLLPGATATPSWEGAGVPAERMMPAEDVARAVVDIHRLGERTVVEEVVLRPQLGDV